MRELIIKNKKLTIAVAEILILLICGVYILAAYSDLELHFSDADMQVMDLDRNVSPGTYLDTSYETAKAVVSPAFSLKEGIYYITASYRGNGIIRAGLIYDETRNGVELVEEDEFYLDPQDDSVSYRVKIRDNSPVRFKVRLTGDAVDGDYVQLFDVQVVSSKLTCVYSIFGLVVLLIIIDLLLFGYFRYYKVLSPERKMICIILAVTAFFAGLPFYQPGLAFGPDLTFHLQRIEGVYKGLLSGQFPVRIQPGWLEGNGYAASIFYGDIFLYFPAVLRMIGFTIQEAYKIYAVTVNIATVLITFYAFYKITKNDMAAMTGVVLYVCSVNRLWWMHVQAVGAYSGMMFYPLIIMAFYLIFTEDIKDKTYKRLWLPLTLGFSGLLMTHMISCLMVGLFSLLACLIMIKRVFRKETFIVLCKAVFISILLNLWYLVPFLQYMLTEKLYINTHLTEDVKSQDYYALLADFAQDGRNFYSLLFEQDTIGYALLLILLLYIITIPIQKKDSLTKTTRFFFLYMVFVFWVCMDFFPIEKLAQKSMIILKYCQAIQYQNRLLCVAVALSACLGALFIALNVFEKKTTYLIIGLLCCVTLYQNMRFSETVVSEVVYLEDIDLDSRIGKRISDYGIGNAEYLPIATDTQQITKELQADEMLQIVMNEGQYLTYDTRVINETDQERSVLYPVLYYEGYRTFDLQNYNELETTAGDNGRVEVKVPAGYAGTFHMAFHEPWFWRLAEIVSLLTFMFIIYYEAECHGIKISIKNIIRKEHERNGN